jgi:hypothetical protein
MKKQLEWLERVIQGEIDFKKEKTIEGFEIVKSVNCPKCDGTNLKFDEPYFYANIVSVAIECSDCGLVGTQEHKLIFLGTKIE